MKQNGTQADDLTGPQLRLIAALLVSRNTLKACETAKIPRSTAYRWFAEPRFRAALASAEGGQIDDATRRLLGLVDKAIDELESVLDDADAPRSVKVRASGLVLDQLLALRGLRNGESRLAALEALLVNTQL